MSFFNPIITRPTLRGFLKSLVRCMDAARAQPPARWVIYFLLNGSVTPGILQSLHTDSDF